MSVILQINFVNDVSEEELAANTSLDGAKAISELPGLHWKVWLRNPQSREGGGIYLFDTRAQAEAWVAGPVISGLRQNPKVSDFSAKIFEVREEVSRITRAPLDSLATV